MKMSESECLARPETHELLQSRDDADLRCGDG